MNGLIHVIKYYCNHKNDNNNNEKEVITLAKRTLRKIYFLKSSRINNHEFFQLLNRKNQGFSFSQISIYDISKLRFNGFNLANFQRNWCISSQD